MTMLALPPTQNQGNVFRSARNWEPHEDAPIAAAPLPEERRPSKSGLWLKHGQLKRLRNCWRRAVERVGLTTWCSKARQTKHRYQIRVQINHADMTL